MPKQMKDLSAIVTITDDVKIPCSDPTGLSKTVSIAQLKEFGLGGGGGGSPIAAVQQNVINAKNFERPALIKNSGFDAYMDQRNIIYTLASNYSAGAMSIELICTSPISTFKPIYPCRLMVYDGTNKSYAVITGFTSGTNYTLENALVNQTGSQVGYSTSGTVVKLKMKTQSGGIATPATGTTGQALAFPENFLVDYLQEAVAEATLYAFRDILCTEYAVAGIPSPNTTEITSGADHSTVFPAGTPFVIYHKKDNGGKIVSKKNETWGKNYSVFVTSASSTFGSGKVTLTHSAKVNTGAAANGEYYILKLPTTKAIVEFATEAGIPIELVLNSLVLNSVGFYVFSDSFTGTDGALANNWVVTRESGDTTWTSVPQIVANALKQTSGAPGYAIKSRVCRNLEAYKSSNGYNYYHTFVATTNEGTHAMRVNFYADSTTVDGNGGIGVEISRTGSTIKFLNGATVLATNSYTFTSGTTYKLRYFISLTEIKIKIWTAAVEPDAWNFSYTTTTQMTPFGEYLKLWFYNFNGNQIIDDVFITYANGSITLGYELEDQAGDKVTITTLTEINAATLEFLADLGVGYILQAA